MKKHIIYMLLLALVFGKAAAQSPLQKSITIEVNRQQLSEVLELISKKGGVSFSYNSAIIKKDSLVSFSVRNKTVKEVLQGLFSQGYEFYEDGNYIIIRKVRSQQSVTPVSNTNESARIFFVTGYVYDELSGKAIKDASVYEKKFLYSALTDQDGFFRIKFKRSSPGMTTLTISKEFYADTVVKVVSKINNEVYVTLTPLYLDQNQVRIYPDVILPKDTVPNPAGIVELISRDTPRVQQTAAGKFLLSEKQKKHSVNLSKFTTARAVQVSFVPGFTTHGQLGSQVVSNFSFNVLGGYTACVRGAELGGLFNIDKGSVQYAQVAGIVNIVGGRTTGFQLAGVNNLVLDSVYGCQIGGISNIVKGSFKGFQTAGIQNHIAGTFSGVQVAGILNTNAHDFSGFQLAGLLNIVHAEMKGLQISGLVNYAHKLHGVQVGLVNIADSSEGLSIGLINIVKHGYNKLSLSSNEVQNVNLAYKSGNAILYSILQAGLYAGDNNKKLYSAGYGIGSNLYFNRSKSLSFNPELLALSLYRGSWDNTNFLFRLQLQMNVKVARGLSLFAGPAISMMYSDQKNMVSGYGSGLPPSGYKLHTVNSHTSAWLGWNAGINIF